MKSIKITDYQEFTTIDTPKEERRRLNVGDIWANQASCKVCGDLVRSRNKHDYRSCKCGSITVDGGSWYARRIGDINNIVELSVVYNDVNEKSQTA